MAYDEDLAERVRLAMAGVPDLIERKMFGGLAFMAGDHMAVGIARDALMVRLGKDGATAALERPHVRRMDMTGTPMTSIVLVAPAGTADDDALQAWVDEALTFVRTLPPKRQRERRAR
ncbi:MAG: TfoX/Sxy family protein [Thermoleophilia bacterium]